MDSVFTPYNGMFAFINKNTYKTSTIAVKLNNTFVPYSNNLWWKKDFFENSISLYSRYIINSKQVGLFQYINRKSLNTAQKEFLFKRLTPDRCKVKIFPSWLVNYAGQGQNDNSSLEFLKYDFIFLDNKMVLIDSTILFKIKVANGELTN